MRKWIFLCVGQGGIQVGHELMQELFASSERDAFFHSPDKEDISKASGSLPLPLVASALLIDSESKVIGSVVSDTFGDDDCRQRSIRKEGGWRYDEKCCAIRISDSGAGNNWFRGYFRLGHGQNTWEGAVKPAIMQLLRKLKEDAKDGKKEEADEAINFMVISTLAGGTGSGLGSYITEMLKKDSETRDFFLCNCAIGPFRTGEITLQNYNAMLSLSRIYACSDLIILWNNDQLAMRVKHEHDKNGRLESSSMMTMMMTRSRARNNNNNNLFHELNGIIAHEMSLVLLGTRGLDWKAFISSDRLFRYYKIWSIFKAPQTMSLDLLSFEPRNSLEVLVRRVYDMVRRKGCIEGKRDDGNGNGGRCFTHRAIAVASSDFRKREITASLVSLQKEWNSLAIIHEQLDKENYQAKSVVSFSIQRARSSKSSFLMILCLSNRVTSMLTEIRARAVTMLEADEAYLFHYSRWGGKSMAETREIFSRSRKRFDIILELYRE